MAAKSDVSTARRLVELENSDEKMDRIYAGMLSQAIEKRLHLALTHVEVGQRSGLAPKTISRIERVDTRITIETFLRYLDGLNMEWELKEKRT